MYVKRIDYLGYKLYCLGWRSALQGDRTSPEHILLSVFLYYRKGFTSGTEWAKEYRSQKTWSA
jgi:hypothetical protein